MLFLQNCNPRFKITGALNTESQTVMVVASILNIPVKKWAIAHEDKQADAYAYGEGASAPVVPRSWPRGDLCGGGFQGKTTDGPFQPSRARSTSRQHSRGILLSHARQRKAILRPENTTFHYININRIDSKCFALPLQCLQILIGICFWLGVNRKRLYFITRKRYVLSAICIGRLLKWTSTFL